MSDRNKMRRSAALTAGVLAFSSLAPQTLAAEAEAEAEAAPAKKDKSKFVIAADLDGALGIQTTTDTLKVDGGIGGGIRLGRESRLAALFPLRTEIGFHAHNFFGSTDSALYRPQAGLRFGIDFGLRLSAFAHAGVGILRGPTVDRTSFAWDAGGALSLTAIPLIDFGIHGAYNSLAGGKNSESLNFANFGAHVALKF